jgi:hypothetical protein
MKLYKGRISKIADEIATKLLAEEAIEAEEENLPEITEGIGAILNEYVKVEREITDEAREWVTKRSLDSRLVKKRVGELAEERHIGVGEDTIEYLTNQIISWLMYTPCVEEIWAEDHVMRKAMVGIFKKHMNVDVEIDREVRKRLKNLEEGTPAYDIEYNRLYKSMVERKGLK